MVGFNDIHGRPELEPRCAGCDEMETLNTKLREAGTKICEAFDKGIFIRSTSEDEDPAWAFKLFPYLRALGVLAENKEEGDV
jgi:hypothetical protein